MLILVLLKFISNLLLFSQQVNCILLQGGVRGVIDEVFFKKIYVKRWCVCSNDGLYIVSVLEDWIVNFFEILGIIIFIFLSGIQNDYGVEFVRVSIIMIFFFCMYVFFCFEFCWVLILLLIFVELKFKVQDISLFKKDVGCGILNLYYLIS